MSTNCLLTKLKATVNNPDLPIYNAIVLDVVETENPTVNTQYIYAAGDGVSIEVPSQYPMTDSTHFANGTYKAIIRKKYSISGILAIGDSISTNLEQLTGCVGITKLIGGGKKKGDIKYLSSLINLTEISFQNMPEVIGDISVFENMPNLTNLQCTYTGIIGNISVFAAKTNMTRLNFQNSSGVTGNLEDLGNLINLTRIPEVEGTNIHGSFDEFVSRQVAAGRTSFAAGTGASAGALLTNCTFGGKTRTSGVAWNWPSWDGANKVVVYIGASNYQNCLTIYEKGATAEEIAAWNAAGKTVTDVLTDTVYPPTNQ